MIFEPKSVGLAYLATPYSRYHLGISQAFIDAAKLAARLMLSGIKIYSPIAHTHPIATYGRIDPHDHNIWLPFDEAMMTVCDTLIVAQMEGWDKSFGISCEIEFFEKARKPIFDLDPASMQMTRRGLDGDAKVATAIARIAELNQLIAEARGWGAAVGVMNEERQSLTRFVAARMPSLAHNKTRGTHGGSSA